MPKKKQGVGSALMDFFETLIIGTLKSVAESYLDHVQNKIKDTHRRMMELTLAYAILLLSMVFVSIAAVMLISEYLEVSKGWSFLVVGLLLLLWAMKIKNRRYEYGEKS